MTDPINLALGVAVFLLAVGAAAVTTVLTARFARGGAMVESMMQRSFLPEKQRRYLAVLSIEGGMILLSGLIWGLQAAGALPVFVANWLLAPLLAIGIVCVTTITWLGLRPSHLSSQEQVVLRNRALVSLVLAPMADHDA
ncbi:MAG: hypothetical protein L3J73_03070 [Thermoplasmata archaeon]|nr:hypothetical protein [Thermoplasmata archaeon]